MTQELKDKILKAGVICFDCGEKYGKHKAGVCTVYEHVCDICGENTSCTEFRDFGYEDKNKLIN